MISKIFALIKRHHQIWPTWSWRCHFRSRALRENWLPGGLPSTIYLKKYVHRYIVLFLFQVWCSSLWSHVNNLQIFSSIALLALEYTIVTVPDKVWQLVPSTITKPTFKTYWWYVNLCWGYNCASSKIVLLDGHTKHEADSYACFHSLMTHH